MAVDLVQEVGEDFAPHPGRTQAFPVVAPLSDSRLGPRDLRPPEEVWAKFCQDEAEEDAWRFRRDRAQAALLREQRLASVLRLRADQAEREADAAVALAADRAVDLEWARGDRRRRGEGHVRDLEKRLEEARETHVEVESDCARRLAEAQQLLAEERAHSAVVERMLEEERRRSETARRRVEEIEAESQRRLDKRSADVVADGKEAHSRVEEAREVAKPRVRAAEDRAAASLQLMRAQLAAEKERCAEDVALEAHRRADCEEEVHRRFDNAALRLGVEQLCMRQCAVSTKEDCQAHVERVQKREEDTRSFVAEWQRGSVSQLFEAAASKSREAHRREVLSKNSLEHTVHVLGHHYSTQRQYNTAADARLSGILQGCLHGQAAAAAHSPRSLLPPVANLAMEDRF